MLCKRCNAQVEQIQERDWLCPGCFTGWHLVGSKDYVAFPMEREHFSLLAEMGYTFVKGEKPKTRFFYNDGEEIVEIWEQYEEQPKWIETEYSGFNKWVDLGNGLLDLEPGDKVARMGDGRLRAILHKVYSNRCVWCGKENLAVSDDSHNNLTKRYCNDCGITHYLTKEDK